MEEAQLQLQNALTTTFLANLAFLSEYDNNLFQRVDQLSQMIEKGIYKEKYRLEFIMESGDFDIYDIINDKYLYNKEPKKINDEMVKKIELDEKNSIFDLPEHFIFKDKPEIDTENRFNFEKQIETLSLTNSNMWEYSNVLKDFLDNKKKRLKKVKKFIFLGTLLGRHIPRIADKVDAEMYLVLERNLEIFRLSLFTVDYTILAKKGAIFSIMDNVEDEESKFKHFILLEPFNNYLIKFSTSGINIDEYIDFTLNTLHSLRPTSYDYSRRLYIHANRATKVFSNGYRTLHLDKIKEQSLLFKDIPILYLAAGPSLDENIEWIKSNQDKFFIVTIGAAYKKLLSNNIKVGMIVTVDESTILEKLQFDDESVKNIDKDTILLASLTTHEKILQKFTGDNLFMYELFTPFEKNNIVYDGLSVGEIALAMLMDFNPSEIYILGLDLSLNQETGESHSKESDSMVQMLDLEKVQNRDTFSHNKSLIKVRGNLEEEVFTIPLFYNSIKNAEKKIAKKEDDLEIYNLSSHGAYLKGAIPTKISELNMDNFNTFDSMNKKLIKFLTKNSFTEVSEETKENFKKEISLLNLEIKEMLKNIISNNISSYDEFLNEILVIHKKISESNLPVVYQIINNYFQMIVPYLSYHFNDTKVKKEAKKIKKIKEIFVSQMEEFIDDYIYCLERSI